jgi:hypothetical protein
MFIVVVHFFIFAHRVEARVRIKDPYPAVVVVWCRQGVLTDAENRQACLVRVHQMHSKQFDKGGELPPLAQARHR